MYIIKESHFIQMQCKGKKIFCAFLVISNRKKEIYMLFITNQDKNSKIIYSMQEMEPSLIKIDSFTGEIIVASIIDREVIPFINVTGIWEVYTNVCSICKFK
jgi:hypothetical protein